MGNNASDMIKEQAEKHYHENQKKLSPKKKELPNDHSKWKVTDTPQDTSLIPTLAVALWLGWMGFLVKVSLVVFYWGSSTVRAVWIGLCTLSLLLPPHFPEPLGTKVIGVWLMRQAEKYFGLKTTVEDFEALQEASKHSALIFAKEPHDVLPYSVFCFADALERVLPQQSVAALTTGAVFQIPFIKVKHKKNIGRTRIVREWNQHTNSRIIIHPLFLQQVYSWVGCFPVDKKTFRKRLERKQSFCFVPGGAQEVLMLSEHPGKIPLYLKSRKGFIKMALTTGSPIVPVFAFGLDKSYDFFIPPGLAKLSRSMGFVPVMFLGRFGIPFGIPKRTKIHVVIGSPIAIPKVDGDDEKMSEKIEEYHQIFLQELEALYERHKEGEGYGHRKLLIF